MATNEFFVFKNQKNQKKGSTSKKKPLPAPSVDFSKATKKPTLNCEKGNFG